MTPPVPPWVPLALLKLILVPEDREHALGDLHEEYVSLVAHRGRAAALLWYWAQLWRALGPSIRRRAAGGQTLLVGLGQESRLAIRFLLRRPGLALVSTATLALGIGSATAIVSVATAVLLKPLPYPGGERLVQVWNTYPDWRGHEVLDALWDRINLSYPEYRDWSDAQTSFDGIAIYGSLPLPLTGTGDPEEVLIGAASASLFPLLGAEPSLGRAFTMEEEGLGAPRVAILSHRTWRDRFGADPEVIGRDVELAGVRFAVIGVLPPDFHLRSMSLPTTETHAVWVPIGGLGEELGRGNHSYEALGRLASGVTLARASQETERILTGGAPPESRGARFVYRKEAEIGDARRPLLLLLAAVSILVLIACGNVAMLLIGEAFNRRRELATRSAIGAGRLRVVRQLVLESALLGLAGALAGLLVAVVGVGVILRLAPPEMALPNSVPLNPMVFAFAVVTGLGTGLVFGLLPGVSAWRRDVHQDLRGGAGDTVGGRRLQHAVLVGQVSLSLVLLAGGGLLARTAFALDSVHPGFEPAGLLTARLSVPRARYSQEEVTSLYQGIVASLAGVAGIERATLVDAMPFSGRGGSSSFDIVGREVSDFEKQPEGNRRTVLSGYHETLGIPLLEGRFLEPSDRIQEAPVVLVSESLARRYWPAGDALGKRISRDRREWEIVGVVGDVRHADLAAVPQPTFYVPFEVAENRHVMTLVVGSTLSEGAVLDLIRGTVWAADPDVPIEDVATASALIARTTQDERFRSLLLVIFAVAATALSAVGLFGVTNGLVSGRRRELGIRMALGAHRGSLVRRIVGEEGGVLTLGLLVGVAGALLAGRVLASFLFEVGPGDPISIGGAVVLLALTGFSASWMAAQRGTALDPLEAIRTE